MTEHEQGSGQRLEAMSFENEGEVEIDISALLYRLLERIGLIIALGATGLILSSIYTFSIAIPQYEATAKLYVMSANDSAINLSDLQIGSYLTSDYQEVFKTWEVHEMVIKNLNLKYSYSELQKMLKVHNPSDTRILYLTVTSASPREAMLIANEYMSVAQQYISVTMSTEEPNIMSAALLPAKPVKPNKSLNLLLGLMTGMFMAVLIVVVGFLMDDKIKTADDIQKYALMPTLAVVPFFEQHGSKMKKGKGKKKHSGY